MSGDVHAGFCEQPRGKFPRLTHLKTLAGAAIADVITSVVATAHAAGVNVFEYLIALQRHADDVKRQPQAWLPWNWNGQAAAETEKKVA